MDGTGESTPYGTGIGWRGFNGLHDSRKSDVMAIRPMFYWWQIKVFTTLASGGCKADMIFFCLFKDPSDQKLTKKPP